MGDASTRGCLEKLPGGEGTLGAVGVGQEPEGGKGQPGTGNGRSKAANAEWASNYEHSK